MWPFQLTRSVGSVTTLKSNYIWRFHEFQLTRSVGSVTIQQAIINEYIYISTHTLRGERDFYQQFQFHHRNHFNSHAPWGAWLWVGGIRRPVSYFNSHAPWGAWRTFRGAFFVQKIFQLTRSVGSVTKRSVGASDCRRDFNSHAPWGAWLPLYPNPRQLARFQLTRSVGSVTANTKTILLRRHFNSHAPWGAWLHYSATVQVH